MEALDISLHSISELRKIIGGMSSVTKNFIACDDILWEDFHLHEPYRAAASAFILCTRGEMTVTIGVKKHLLRKDCIMLYGHGNVIEVLEKSDDFSASVIIITREFTQNVLLDLQSVMPIYNYLTEETNDLLHLDEKEVALIKKYFEIVMEVSRDDNHSILMHLLAAFFRTVSDMYGKRVVEGPRINTRQEEYFERFVLAVSQFHREQRSVQFYADLLHITPKYLSSVIKEASGRSAAQWIDEFVIQEAKVLLKYSTKSVQEITYHLNFSTQSFFGKFFKRHTSMSPSQYRAR